VVVVVGVVTCWVIVKGVVSSWVVAGVVSLVSTTFSVFLVTFSVNAFFVDWIKRRVDVDRVVGMIVLVPE